MRIFRFLTLNLATSNYIIIFFSGIVKNVAELNFEIYTMIGEAFINLKKWEDSKCYRKFIKF